MTHQCGSTHARICISQDIHRHLHIELAYFLRENTGVPNDSDAEITEARIIRSFFGQAHQDDYILVIQQGLQKNGVVGFAVCVVRAVPA